MLQRLTAFVASSRRVAARCKHTSHNKHHRTTALITVASACDRFDTKWSIQLALIARRSVYAQKLTVKLTRLT